MARRRRPDIKIDQRRLRQLTRDKGMRRAMEERTGAVAEAARQAAPMRTGAYREGITPVVEQGPDGWEGRVEARHFTSHWIEFGTLRSRAYAPLRRGLEAVFGRIDTNDRRGR